MQVAGPNRGVTGYSAQMCRVSARELQAPGPQDDELFSRFRNGQLTADELLARYAAQVYRTDGKLRRGVPADGHRSTDGESEGGGVLAGDRPPRLRQTIAFELVGFVVRRLSFRVAS